VPQFDHQQVRSVVISSLSRMTRFEELEGTVELHAEEMSPMNVSKVISNIFAGLVEEAERRCG
jgi:hypothetical protein